MVKQSYYIKWLDSMSHRTGWTTDKMKDFEPSWMETVAYIVDEDKDFIQIAHTVGVYEDEAYNHHDIFLIPKGVIVEKKELKLGKNR